MKTIEVQTGNDVPVSVNLKAYLGENANVTNTQVTGEQPDVFRVTDINLDNYTLTFKVSSIVGTTGSIVLNATTANCLDYTLTIPVVAKAKTTEIKLETTGMSTAVEGVTVSGLENYTNSQTGDMVKVELDVKTVNEPTDNGIKTNIENKIALIYPGMSTAEVKKEYLDISINKTVNDGEAQPVRDLGRVIEIAVRYDLSGKFNPVVIREHDGTVTAFTALSDKPDENNYQDGTFYIDADKGIIYIYTEFFSTYSIAYATTDSCTVSFDAQGGTGVDAIVVKANGTISNIPTSSRSGYSFDGWFPLASGEGDQLTDTTEICEDITYYAHWTYIGGSGGGNTPTPVYYTVSFNMNGREATDVPNDQRIEKGKCAAEPSVSPKAEKYVFSGWYADAKCENIFDFSSPITADTVVYAKWIDEEAEAFTVTFDLNGKAGMAPSAQRVEKDGVATEPTAPSVERYTFTGWYKEASCNTKFDFNMPVTADITLYAGWETKSDPGPEPGPAINDKTALDPVGEIDDETTDLYLVKGQKFNIGKQWSIKKDDGKSKKCVSISKKGVITAKKAGEATIWEGDRSIDVHVSEPLIAKSLKLTIENSVESVSGQISLTNPASLPVYWFSASPDVATVDQNGNVTAVAAGSTTVTVYINGMAYSCKVKVIEKVPAKERTVHMLVGASRKIKIKNVSKATWSSADEKIAYINKESKVIAKNPGETILTATDNKTRNKYKVNLIVEDITLRGEGLEKASAGSANRKYTLKIKAGETTELSFAVVEQNVIFKSNKPEIAIIDENGLLTARAPGKSTLTAKCYGKTITVKVIVE